MDMSRNLRLRSWLLRTVLAVGLAALMIISSGFAGKYAVRADNIVPPDPYRITEAHTVRTGEILRCVNSQTTLAEEHTSIAQIGFTAFHLWAADGQSVFITDSVGGHPTWIVALSIADETFTAYETYGMEGDNRTVLFRQETPQDIRQAFTACGAPFVGIWTGQAPFPLSPLPSLDPSDPDLLPTFDG